MYRTLIDSSTLHRLLDAGGANPPLLFDCLFDLTEPAAGAHAFDAAHLPGARYLHLDDDLSGPQSGSNGRHPLPDPAQLAATLRAQGLRHVQQVVAYDRHAGQVLRNLGQGAFLVIDARSAERFHGGASPFDTVAGHIPGARNRFFKDNLDAQGYFKDGAALRADFLAVLAGYSPAEVVLQCGSGVTACHNALALEVAGLPGARLYPGSWSEWTADRARPVARPLG